MTNAVTFVPDVRTARSLPIAAITRAPFLMAALRGIPFTPRESCFLNRITGTYRAILRSLVSHRTVSVM